MKRSTILFALAAVVLMTLPASAARKKPRPAPPQGPIACTHYGCQPIPPGCHSETGYLWNGMPSGYDVIVCPGNR